MSDITINYNGSSIATMDAVGTKKLLTKDKICRGDITVDFVPPSNTRFVEVTYNGNILATLSESGSKRFIVDGKYCEDDILVIYKTQIPPEYKEVAYLSGNGLQYINTPLAFNSSLDMTLSALVINPNVSQRKIIMGSYQSDGTKNYNIEFGSSGQSHPGEARLYINTSSYVTVWTSTAFPANTDLHFDLSYSAATKVSTLKVKYGTTTVTRTLNSSSLGTFVATHTFRLFRDFRPSSAATEFPLILGRITLSIGTNSIDLVPCVRVADSVAGMYDLISGSFLTNSGSGSFTPGPDV